MKTKKTLTDLEKFESTNLNEVIGGITGDESTASGERKKKGTSGTSSNTGWSYTDDSDGSNKQYFIA